MQFVPLEAKRDRDDSGDSSFKKSRVDMQQMFAMESRKMMRFLTAKGPDKGPELKFVVPVEVGIVHWVFVRFYDAHCKITYYPVATEVGCEAHHFCFEFQDDPSKNACMDAVIDTRTKRTLIHLRISSDKYVEDFHEQHKDRSSEFWSTFYPESASRHMQKATDRDDSKPAIPAGSPFSPFKKQVGHLLETGICGGNSHLQKHLEKHAINLGDWEWWFHAASCYATYDASESEDNVIQYASADIHAQEDVDPREGTAFLRNAKDEAKEFVREILERRDDVVFWYENDRGDTWVAVMHNMFSIVNCSVQGSKHPEFNLFSNTKLMTEGAAAAFRKNLVIKQAGDLRLHKGKACYQPESRSAIDYLCKFNFPMTGTFEFEKISRFHAPVQQCMKCLKFIK